MSAKSALVQMTGVSDAAAEFWLDLLVEVLRVRYRASQHQGPAGAPGRRDREVRRLLRGDPAEPQQRSTSGTQRPAVAVDPVWHDGDMPNGTCATVRAVCAETAANRVPTPPEASIADSNQGVGGVCTVVNIGTDSEDAMATGR